MGMDAQRTFKCERVMEKHLMKKTSVQQQVEIAKENNWEAKDDQRQVVKDHGDSPQTY